MIPPKAAEPLAWAEPFLESYDGCPVCASTDWTLQYTLGILKVRPCRKCGLLFLNPCLKPDKQKMIFSSPDYLARISGFFADYHDDSSWVTEKTASIYRRVIDQCEDLLPAKGKILDVGCGKGSFLQLAKKRGWAAAGVEPNFDAAKQLRDRHGIEAYDQDFFDLPLAEKSFDVISLWDLIEHTPDPVQWMARSMRLLKPGGLFVVATPNHHSFLDWMADLLFRLTGRRNAYALRKLYTIDHTLYLTDKTLRLLYERTGFDVVTQIKVCTDLSRYTMSPVFRLAAESMLTVSRLLRLENRIIMIGRKPERK